MTVICAELANSESIESESSDRNPIFRDNDWLGIPTHNPDFQDKCFKSNSKANVTPTEVETCYIPSHGYWPVVTLLLGSLLSEMLLGRKVTLFLPISADWKAKQKRKERINKAFIVGGLFGIVFGAFFCCVAMVIDERVGEWLLYSLAIFPLISVGAVFYQFVSYQPIAQIRYIDDQFVWVSGADPAYLAGLPDLNDRGHEREQLNDISNLIERP